MEVSTEDKAWWVLEGARKEVEFVERVCPQIGISAIINPEKEKNPYAPDLLVDGKLADLKTQNTPFFTAGLRFGISPQFAVTFNHKDYVRYYRLYPEIEIYFWIDWQTHRWGRIFITPMIGVWHASFDDIREQVIASQKHAYKRRTNDRKGNARESYVLDLRKLNLVWKHE